jgi:hypothetical protein
VIWRAERDAAIIRNNWQQIACNCPKKYLEALDRRRMYRH